MKCDQSLEGYNTPCVNNSWEVFQSRALNSYKATGNTVALHAHIKYLRANGYNVDRFDHGFVVEHIPILITGFRPSK